MDPRTAEFYHTRSREWANALPPGWSRDLDPFLDRLPAAAHILELGCGDGRDAAQMEARGFTVDASDGVAQMAALASERLGRAVPTMAFAELAAEVAYDAAWCHASLLHIPLGDLPEILARVRRALRAEALFYASFKGSAPGHEANSRDDFGRLYSYVSSDDLKASYGIAGPWREFEIVTGEGDSFGGERAVWHSVMVRR